jgi:probable HAF family extracellular repeat protein
MQGLGDLQGGAFESVAYDVSDDGSIVVGVGTTAAPGDRAFIWDAAHGMRDLRTFLVNDVGLDLTGWTLMRATGISSDGLTIAGTGANPNGQLDGWIAVVPEPSSMALLGLGGVALLRRRARRR